MIPESVEEYATILWTQRDRRRKAKRRVKAAGMVRRRSLSLKQREKVLGKTKKRCHICGGKIKEGDPWQADHILAVSTGGPPGLENYLPAHALCNNYRWDYSSEEVQEILKLGVWVRTQIIRRTRIGQDAGEQFLSYERARNNRRKS